jgi:hypothetical protein
MLSRPISAPEIMVRVRRSCIESITSPFESKVDNSNDSVVFVERGVLTGSMMNTMLVLDSAPLLMNAEGMSTVASFREQLRGP